MNNWSIMWAGSENLIYIPVLILLCILLMYRLRCWQSVKRLLASEQSMIRGGSLSKEVVKTFLLFLGIFFLFLALLRPQWNKKEKVINQEGRDLFIALDISRSMLAQDCLPSRLTCAKEKIRSLIKQCCCERIGLIIFSGSTFVQCPLTTDYGAFFMFLDKIDVETISSGTTAIDQAIGIALKTFKSSDRKTKLLAIFTDGEDFSSNLTGVKQEAAREQLTIFTFGVGTAQGAPIPLFDERGKHKGHQLDKKGSVVISRLNEGILKSLAQDCGGIYIKMTADDTDITTLMNQVKKFEKEKFADKKVTQFEEQYPYFVAISFICLALEWIL